MIPFNRPFMTGRELEYIEQARAGNMLAGDGPFTKRCQRLIEAETGSARALLTHSCTGALEMAALLLDIRPGDEIIMPSYTFVSTANAFVLRGGIPVFVDIRDDTLNLNERMVESAVTKRTRAIAPVHYAGVSCAMDAILDTARRHNLKVVEDAAQGYQAKYRDRPLGSMGDLGAYSFHETKNVISGEGGALLVNDPALVDRAEILWEKGTDRSRFFRGQVDKYTWQDVGSSFLPGELVAAFLWAQLEVGRAITARRLESWNRYHAQLAPMEAAGLLRRPVIPGECEHNAHMYYVLFPSEDVRSLVVDELKRRGVNAVLHYVPLHSSPAGLRYGRTHGALTVTEHIAGKLLRLPMWVGITESQQSQVVDVLAGALHRAMPGRA